MNITIIEAAIQAMIDAPSRSSVNSNTTHVVFNLRRSANRDEYVAYRDWVTMWRHTTPSGWERIVAMQAELDAIDGRTTMPAWATYGT